MSAESHRWQTDPPEAAGTWEMRSDETNREPSPVEVYDRAGTLWVDDPHIGRNPLDVYHYNLTRIEWRKPAP